MAFWKTLVGSLLGSLFVAIALVLYFQPKALFTPLQYLAIIGVIDFLGMIAAVGFKSKHTAGGIFVKTLVYSALFALALTYLLQPKNSPGVDISWIFVFSVQIFAYFIAYKI